MSRRIKYLKVEVVPEFYSHKYKGVIKTIKVACETDFCEPFYYSRTIEDDHFKSFFDEIWDSLKLVAKEAMEKPHDQSE